ncbi:SDR family oxidoreductase [Actinophytocola oryzae]|uniref:NAD(P)-dependent dehydrogenase (Short-subunit alcohol dehydrogenase family) n=1 Tax=Actinophytocola oryzae TaxID=502181 RepID=A0A4R7W1C2_9PSEU|nr:SDR family oxidoreductase [Actinophytocola oryzae]TDV56212.1 NAD(P)-dependent dehydrogenase (short-subunit alcohol dehydrogenase family) [Actinophytocola oryzae]
MAEVVSAESLFGLTGRTAVITGGTRGVGRAAAEALLGQGAEVMVTSRSADEAAAAQRELSELGKAHAVAADLGDQTGVTRFASEVLERFPQVHVLVNNAGRSWGAPFEDYPAGAFTKLLQLNTVAPFHLVQALLPALTAAATEEDPARVINIGSIDGHAVGPFQNYGYATAKAALHHLTRVLARELGPRHITVNCLALGPILTRLTSVLLDAEGERMVRNNPLGRIGRLRDVCAPVLLLAGPGGSYLTGAVLPVDGGYAVSRWCDG